MKLTTRWLGAALLALGLLAGARAAHAAETTTVTTPAADPAVWGPYAQLVGTTWRGSSNGNAEWQWGPDNTIVESRTFMLKTEIRAGATPGELVSVYGGGLHTFDGRIAADGSVLWIRRGRFIKMPSRASIVDGRFVEEMVKLDDSNQVARVIDTARFEQTGGATVDMARVATRVANAAPLTTAAATPASQAELVTAVPVAAAAPVAAVPTPAAQPIPAPAPLAPPNPALFGPYAQLLGLSHITAEGWEIRWYQVSDTTIVHEVRSPAGTVENLQLIKTTGPGTLAMLRSGWCPDSVCGQTGIVADGVAQWREPKASGGYAGGYMDAKVWVENSDLVMYTVDPSPGGAAFYDQYPQYRPVPQRLALVKSPALTAAQMEEGRAKVAQLDPVVESEVSRAIGKQMATAQSFADARAAREKSSARVRSFNRAMESIGGALSEASAQMGTYDEAQARLDATVANVQAHAEYERQAQAQAQQQAPPRAADYPTQVAERVTQPQPKPQTRESEKTAAEPAAPSAGKPLRFVMSISLRNQPGDKVNPTCYSNIISRPGPPGWGAPGFLPPGSAEQARESVYELKSAFIAQCRASGREITSDGNFNFQMNQSQGDEERLQGMRARYSEDVSVSL